MSRLIELLQVLSAMATGVFRDVNHSLYVHWFGLFLEGAMDILCLLQSGLSGPNSEG